MKQFLLLINIYFIEYSKYIFDDDDEEIKFYSLKPVESYFEDYDFLLY
jgi:hypothetical protein